MSKISSRMSTGGVFALAGLLLVVSGFHALATGSRQPHDMASLVVQESARVEDLSTRASRLNQDIESLTERTLTGTDIPQVDPETAQREGVAAGFEAVSGPALTVTLDDAPASALDTAPGNPQPNQLVVHQQDLQNVINALWAGGAEAMTLQGERVTTTSAFRCSGNILLLHGKVFSPPYKVTAVGDLDAMRDSLKQDKGVQTYQEFVEWVHLGWDVKTHDQVQLPAAQPGTDLQYARTPEGTDVFA